LAFEVDGGGVEKDQVQSGEQVSLAPEEAFLDEILGASRTERSGVFLILDLFAQEGHGSVEMMQPQIFRPRNHIVAQPLAARPVRSTHHEPMKDRGENGPFHIETEQAIPKQVLKDLPKSKLIPQASEDQSRADRPSLGSKLALGRKNEHCLLREAGKGSGQFFKFSGGIELIQPSDGGDNPLTNLGTLSPALDDLNVLIGS
jgi:hypothetical protein